MTYRATDAKKKNGGKREGAGRKKGSTARRLIAIRDMSEKAMKSTKQVPLGIMLKNMNRFDEEADALYAKYLEIKSSDPQGSTTKALKHYIEELLSAWDRTRECTLDAQRCAAEAAPFMHQKLTAAVVTVEDKTINRIRDETAMSDDELAEYYNALRLRPTSVKPLVLDNKTGEPVSVPYAQED